MRTINEIEECINKSTLSPENKERLLRLCAMIKAWIIRLKKAIDSIVRFLRRHADFCETMAVAILLSMIASLIPLVGNLLSTLILLAGFFLALLKDVGQGLNNLLELIDVEKELNM